MRERLDEIGTAVVDSALQVHSALGPGLLESVYETCLAHELQKRGHGVGRQVALPVKYDGVTLEAAYRLDLVIAGSVIVEVKSVEVVLPVHKAQVLSYLKLSGMKLGYLLNFNVPHMRHGIQRVIHKLASSPPRPPSPLRPPR
jgi:GxxExxY protein